MVITVKEPQSINPGFESIFLHAWYRIATLNLPFIELTLGVSLSNRPFEDVNGRYPNPKLFLKIVWRLKGRGSSYLLKAIKHIYGCKGAHILQLVHLAVCGHAACQNTVLAYRAACLLMSNVSCRTVEWRPPTLNCHDHRRSSRLQSINCHQLSKYYLCLISYTTCKNHHCNCIPFMDLSCPFIWQSERVLLYSISYITNKIQAHEEGKIKVKCQFQMIIVYAV